MKNLPLLIGTLLGTFALVIFVAFAFTKKVNAPIDMTRLIGETKNATGSAQPKATIVEFSDLQCPACKATYPLVKQLVQQNPETVRLVYRHYPLVNVHQNAYEAAQAAEVAASLGKFWEFHDLAFEKQDEWSKLKPDDVKTTFAQYGASLGIPLQFMLQGITDKTFDKNITRDISDGNALGVSATPTFYVNGAQVQIQDLSTAVDKLIKQ